MSATDADRDRAQSVMGWGGLSDQYLTGVEIQQRDTIAYALADEREKARAPFLALCDNVEGAIAHLDWSTQGPVCGVMDSFVQAIRRLAEEAE